MYRYRLALLLSAWFVVVAAQEAANAQPPLPASGQTIHWTAEDSPVLIDGTYTLPEGGTVIADAGIEIRRIGTGMLYIEGVLLIEGTAASPVLLRGDVSYQPIFFVFIGGRADIAHVDSTQRVHAGVGGLSVRDSRFHGTVEPPAFADSYSVPGVSSYRGVLAVRDSEFDHAVIESNDAYVFFENLSLASSRFFLRRFDGGQPTVLDGIDASGYTVDAPFLLTGYDYWLGPNNTIAGNLYPVHLLGGGLAPGSVVPATGNTNDWVHAGIGEARGSTTFADVGVPYVIFHDESFPSLGGRLTIEPGVTVQLGPDARLAADFAGDLIARGTADRPITFERFDPAQPWEGLYFRISRTRPRLEHCSIRGANVGAWTLETELWLTRCRFEDNVIGTRSQNWGTIIARECDFFGNDTGYHADTFGVLDGFADFSDPAMPSWFEGNGLGMAVEDFQNTGVNGRNCYWGDPSGPSHPQNPGGQGDVAQPGAKVLPFVASEPDRGDLPPTVDLLDTYWLLEEGAKVILHWSAADDGTIADQYLLYSSHGGALPLTLLESGIDPSARSIEITVPARQPHSSTSSAVLRLVVVDDAGNTSFDEVRFTTPRIDFEGGLTVDEVPSLVRPAEFVEVCSTTAPGTPLGTRDGYLLLDGDGQSDSIGGTTVECLEGRMPGVSTDTARFGIRLNVGAGSRALWAFSDEFEIRPDPIVTGDTPPTVTLTSPLDGATFPAGSVVPVAWTASDDEGLRSFDLQGSYDGGRTWHLIARELDGAARSYDWRLPVPCDIPDVRVRVIARDHRFQNSSSGADRSFAITPEPAGLLVSLTVQTPVVVAGESLVFDATVMNAGTAAETFDVWLDVTKPNGQPSSRNPVAGPKSITLAPGQTVQKAVRIRIPASTPASGPYTLGASLGSFPDVVAAFDAFTFEVVAP